MKMCYSYLDSCLNFKTPITQHCKITCFASWRKSRYGNDQIFVMEFLAMYLYDIANGVLRLKR